MKLKLHIVFFFLFGLDQRVDAQNAYENYYLYINDYPNRGTPSWSDDVAYYDTYHCVHNPLQPCNCPNGQPLCSDPAGCNQADFCARDRVSGNGTQGIAHDANNWFITTQYILWKIPVTVDLDQDLSGIPGVQQKDLLHVPAIVSAGYDHFGDLDHYLDGDRGYLLVPVQGPKLPSGEKRPPAIAVFRADNLSFLALSVLSDQEGNSFQDGAGWCAVSPSGYLYSSSNTTSKVIRYTVTWNSLRQVPPNLPITAEDAFDLRVRSDDPELHHMQGGEFSPSGNLLYVSCGMLKCDKIPIYCQFFFCGEQWPSDGLHVFDTLSWQEVQRSFNQGSRLSNYPPYFIYRFSNDCEADEPEGLTIWDLDDGRAPNVSGQLHVLLFNHANPIDPFSDDLVSLKHYSEKVYVDASAPPPPPRDESLPVGEPLPGTAARPFNSIYNAFDWYNPVWDGAEIVIKAGSFPETGIFSRRVRLISKDGTAVIGK